MPCYDRTPSAAAALQAGINANCPRCKRSEAAWSWEEKSQYGAVLCGILSGDIVCSKTPSINTVLRKYFVCAR